MTARENDELIASIEKLKTWPGYLRAPERNEVFDKIILRLRTSAAQGWMAIESAPRDESVPEGQCLFWLPESNRIVTTDYCWWLTTSKQWSTDDQPTHWQPLPTPPEKTV